ncbi:MAG: 4-oxalomesaconate tautomerase [Streptosporangiaceae bacterium]
MSTAPDTADQGADAGVRCMLMRGGTSKGGYFLREDLPADSAVRDDVLMRVMGTPDVRQIDGVGGAHPLTSKVAVVSASGDSAADVDYLFLQVGVGDAMVSDRQNCGNMLAGVGPFAVERGLAPSTGDTASVRIRMLNTGGLATAVFPTPGGRVRYSGDTAISGVPGTAAAIVVNFSGTEGSSCGRLLPTGRVRDVIDGVSVTCVDNGMPAVLIAAGDLGATGYESPAELEARTDLVERLQSIRLAAGQLMGLGDVAEATVPKMTLVSPPKDGGLVSTRTFIPVRCHSSIGVLGAVSVATAVLIDDAVGHDLAEVPSEGSRLRLEHPTGHFEVEVEVELDPGDVEPRVRRCGVVRTARRLFDGTVFPRSPAA